MNSVKIYIYSLLFSLMVFRFASGEEGDFVVAAKQVSPVAQQKATKKKAPAQKPKKAAVPTPTVDRYADIVMNLDSGEVLRETQADAIRHPASLTKLMTLYLTFEALANGTIKLEDKVVVSKRASEQQRVNLNLSRGESISIHNLILSLVVLSANDSAVVLAEKLGSTEYNFSLKMTEKAKKLGLTKTVFKNASGLHHPEQVTTAREMAKLMVALYRDFPQYYHLLSALNFKYHSTDYTSHTNVMKTLSYVKAGKTGYVRASGFNLVVGAEKNGRRLVAVVMGGVTAKARDDKMISLLNQYID